jgi:hypothetical protein
MKNIATVIALTLAAVSPYLTQADVMRASTASPPVAAGGLLKEGETLVSARAPYQTWLEAGSHARL